MNVCRIRKFACGTIDGILIQNIRVYMREILETKENFTTTTCKLYEKFKNRYLRSSLSLKY